jgi:hypothetical protein
MWICLNDAFLSIVHKECGPDELLVRARRPGDIERIFPHAQVESRSGTDYQFRAVLPRADVAAALMTEAMTIDYDNFKGATRDRRLHDAYAGFWNLHARLQPRQPYAGNGYAGRLF